MPMPADFVPPTYAARPTLLFLHASATTGRAWEVPTAALRDTATLLAPDRLGYARGQRWVPGAPASFDAEAEHLAPLHLRSPQGGIALRRVKGNVQGAVTSAVDERVQLVGYGPSASTIGASRAGRQAALAVRRHLRG